MENTAGQELSSDHIVRLRDRFLTDTEASEDIGSSHPGVMDKQYWIRLANTQERKTMSSVLVTRLYSGKGYSVSEEESDPRDKTAFTLLTQDASGQPIGTLTIGIDSPCGLYADILYPEEVDGIRKEGGLICEFRKFAISPEVKNKRAIASIFHIALLYVREFFGVTDCISEVTPVHARFYEHFLEARRIGAEKLCPRVDTVGVLMHLNMIHAEKRALESGGTMASSLGDKTLYPFFFSPRDARGILGRLKEIEKGTLEEVNRIFCKREPGS